MSTAASPIPDEPVPEPASTSQPVGRPSRPGIQSRTSSAMPAEQSEGAAGVKRQMSGVLHHVEVWVPDLDRAIASLGWLLETLGYTLFQSWDSGRSWRLGMTYLVFEQSPDLIADRHDRCRPGLNHLAFHVADQTMVQELAAEAPQHGWRLMFSERHPHAGGDHHYAAYLENTDGFEVELVATDASQPD